jgi:hypothetical protein
MAPRPLAKLSLSRGDEVPHVFIGESHQRARKILISSGKRLLQQNLPTSDSCTAANGIYSIVLVGAAEQLGSQCEPKIAS